jgi:hypothetical protein
VQLPGNSRLRKVTLVVDEDGYIDDESLAKAAEAAMLTVESKEFEELRKATGFHIFPDNAVINLPIELMQQSDVVFKTLSYLAVRAQWRISTYKSELNCTTKPSADNLMYGILRGVVTPKFTRFSAQKKDRDLGYAYAMALRMKNVYENKKQVDILEPNNHFFGNNPGEVLVLDNRKKIEVGYELKAGIVNCFSESSIGEIYYRALNHFFRCVGWDTTDPDDVDKYEATNLKKFDHVVQVGWQFIFQKKGNKKQLMGVRKGVLPNRSSLFTKEEMAILRKCLSPFFESLETLKKNFKDTLTQLGISAVKAMISREYRKRHLILERFSSVTTKRLNEIRKGIDSKSLKKKDVTTEMVKTLLSARQDPSKDFLEEIRSIIGSANMGQVFSLFEILGQAPDQGAAVLSHNIVDVYTKLGLYGEELHRPELDDIKIDDGYIRMLENGVKNSRGLLANIITVQNNIGRYCNLQTPEARGVIRTPMTNNIISLQSKVEALIHLPEEIYRRVCNIQWEALGYLTSYDSLREAYKFLAPLIDQLNLYKADNKTLKKDADATVLALIESAKTRIDGLMLVRLVT